MKKSVLVDFSQFFAYRPVWFFNKFCKLDPVFWRFCLEMDFYLSCPMIWHGSKTQDFGCLFVFFSIFLVAFFWPPISLEIWTLFSNRPKTSRTRHFCLKYRSTVSRLYMQKFFIFPTFRPPSLGDFFSKNFILFLFSKNFIFFYFLKILFFFIF